jgi:SAM-dependent methyltransferase
MLEVKAFYYCVRRSNFTSFRGHQDSICKKGAKPVNPQHSLSDEEFCVLSKSPIWDIQRAYFEQMGMDAWKPGNVPNYITTNPFIAQAYARIVDGFFQDYGEAKSRGSRANKHYILEIGAGSGRFAYGFLKYFYREAEMLRRKNIQIVYVMTDISPATIKFWQNHSQLQPYIDQGVLDFSHVDVLDKTEIRLTQSGTRLYEGSTETPLVVIANYVFDSIPHDLFTVKDGGLCERRTAHQISTTSDSIQDIVSDTKIAYRDFSSQPECYNNQVWNKILRGYQATHENLNLALPVGGFQLIDRVSALTRNTTFILTSDFGDTDQKSIAALTPRRVAQNGCFSLRVNYHALSEYVRLKRGKILTPSHPKLSLETVGYLLNPGRRTPKKLTELFARHIEEFGPDEFYLVKKQMEAITDNYDVEKVLSILRISIWDTKIFNYYANAISQQISKSGHHVKMSVVDALGKVDEHYFRSSSHQDPTSKILKLLMKCDAKQKLFDIFKKHETFLASSIDGRLVSARTLIYLEKDEQASKILTKILSKQPDQPEAQRLLQTLEMKSIERNTV